MRARARADRMSVNTLENKIDSGPSACEAYIDFYMQVETSASTNSVNPNQRKPNVGACWKMHKTHFEQTSFLAVCENYQETPIVELMACRV